MPYLLKTEPETYSFADLQKDHETVWDGVTNPVAVRNLAAMKPGDQLIIYHTGGERLAVGTAEVVSVHVDGKTPVVKIKAGKAISSPHSLAEIKQHSIFDGSPLVTQGRLSVVPLTAAQFSWLAGK